MTDLPTTTPCVTETDSHGREAGRRIRTGIFAGSFDPFTTGHDLIAREALRLFDRVVVAVGYNEHKPGMTPTGLRTEAIGRLYAGEPRIEVVSYTGLTVRMAEAYGKDVWLIRGVRGGADYEYERTLAETNMRISGIRTLMIPTQPDMACISSSMVRELIHNGYDVSEFVPGAVYESLAEAIRENSIK